MRSLITLGIVLAAVRTGFGELRYLGDYEEKEFQVAGDTWTLHRCAGGYALDKESAEELRRPGWGRDFDTYEVLESPDGRIYKGDPLKGNGGVLGVGRSSLRGGAVDFNGRVILVTDRYTGNDVTIVTTEQAYDVHSTGDLSTETVFLQPNHSSGVELRQVVGKYYAAYETDGSFAGLVARLTSPEIHWNLWRYSGQEVQELLEHTEREDGITFSFRQTHRNGIRLVRPQTVTIEFSFTTGELVAQN